ncbi:uncharacterized protein ACNLHF_023902 isoform 1-T5 [Anomaloglossus baeobatrachus]|uniref:uncharacterized protein LOC142243676 n=1 Tax=Anomaloglossus baeobatrachus TaxID=238106 RepID=UPI003F5028CE
MNTLTSVTLLLSVLSVVIQGNSPSRGQVKSSGQMEVAKKRGSHRQPMRMIQRGRKKSIWSYNPGHRSLAFLVAGGVDTVSPPPVEPGTGEYRCLGCCGDRVTAPGKASAAPKISNRVSRILLTPEGFGDLGTEPNSINDRCLGCCEQSVTPSLRVTTVTERRTITGSQKRTTAANQQPRQTPKQRKNEPRCTSARCNPDWRYEASSSSEEMPVIRRQRPRSRLQAVQLRPVNRCRHLGCRSALGAAQDDSSSSEED